MSASLPTVIQPAATRTRAACAPLFSACWNGIARYVAHRAAIARLRELDDRALRDIGLARSQIEAAVHGFAIGPGTSGQKPATTGEAGTWT